MLQIFKKIKVVLAICLISMSSLKAQDKKVWTLKACVDQALSKNITIQQQALSTKSTRADYFQSKMATLPSFNGNLSNNWQTGFAINPATNLAKEGVSFRTNSFGVNSSMPLFNGFQTVNTIRLQKSNVMASEMDLQQTKNNITLNVCNAYLRVLLNIELMNAAKSRVASSQAQVDRQKKLYELGGVNKSKFLQLKAQLSTEELAAINAENAVMQAYLELWLLIEVKPDLSNTVELPNFEAINIEDEPRTLDAIYEDFSKVSPDVIAASHRSRSAEITHQVAQGGRSPRLTLSAGLNSFYSTQSQTGIGDMQYRSALIGAGEYNSTPIPIYTLAPIGYSSYKITSFNDQFNRNLGSSIGLNLAVPIFNAWNVNTNIQKTEINFQNSRLNEKLIRNNLYRNIAQSYVDFKSAYKKFAANAENLAANKEAFEVADKQFELGGMSMADYLNTKNSYISAQANYTQAKYELVFRRKVLDFYEGKLLY